MAEIPVVSRRFTPADQVAFAQISGDWNPMHMNDLLSRRTQAGAPVVHGMHAALWAMETMAQSADLSALASVEIRFDRFLYVNECVTLTISVKRERLVAEISSSDDKLVLVIVKLGEVGIAEPSACYVPSYDLARREPEVIDLDKAERAKGAIAIGNDLAGIKAAFPALSTAIDQLLVDALVKVSTIVGMACPGRDSIFSSLMLKRVAPISPLLEFRTEMLERAFRLTMLAVSGGGWMGGIEAFLRHPPVAQLSYIETCKQMTPYSLEGHRTLVIGGSRGLGEVVAKIAAAGGADVTITYFIGKDDAQRIADEIVAGGGRCKCLHFAADDLIHSLDEVPTPTHIYYFATPKIFGSTSNLYNADKARNFSKIYIDGFYKLCRYYSGNSNNIKVFYPSTVAVENRPKGMTEYAMTKAAAEVLAADITRSMRGVTVEVARLDRLLTDQTASVFPAESPDALAAMLAIVKHFHGDT